jgi:hypothetical protein
MRYYVKTSDGYEFNVTTNEDGIITTNDSLGTFDWIDEKDFLSFVSQTLLDGGLWRFTSENN